MRAALPIAGIIKSITDVGIPVMGHIGLQPQTSVLSQGYRMQGETSEAAARMVEDAKAIEAAGAFCIVVEKTSREVADIITGTVGIPTIGIGAGNGCDGQVLVLQDMLGMYDKMRPKFVKRYMNLAQDVTEALKEYKADVESGTFPAEANCYRMDPAEVRRLPDQLREKCDV